MICPKKRMSDLLHVRNLLVWYSRETYVDSAAPVVLDDLVAGVILCMVPVSQQLLHTYKSSALAMSSAHETERCSMY